MSKIVESVIDEDVDVSGEIELPMKTNVLVKVIEYCQHYQNVDQMTPITTPIKNPKINEVVQQW